MSSNYHRLLLRAAEQHGVFSRHDAQAMEVSRSTLSRALESGKLETPTPGVYVVTGSPSTVMQKLAVLVHSMPDLAAASHDTAAELLGLTRRGIRSFHVVTTRWDRVRRPDAHVHESLDLIPSDVIHHDGVPITAPARTIVDLGASNRWIVESALEHGIRRDLVTLSEVQAVVARVGRRGRRGVGVIRPLLRERRKWATATESALEDLFRRTVDEAGLPEPVAQYVVREAGGSFVCRADFAYPQARVLVELDSEEHHMDRITFRNDRAKQNGAVTLGWSVLRFTGWDLTDDPYGVTALVRALLDGCEPA